MGSGFRASISARLVLALCLVSVVVLPLGSAEVDAASALRGIAASGSATGGKRITVRVELIAPAPAGGAIVSLSSSSPLIPVPGSVRIQAGETESTIGVTTVPTAVDTDVTLTARYGGITKSRVVLIKEPVLSSLSVQSKIRAGGQGKVTVRLSGRAPAGGLTVNVKSNRPSIVPMPGAVTVAAGNASATLIVDAAMVSKDVPVNIIAQYDGVRLVESAIVRNYATATPTPTATLTPTNTATATVTTTPIPDPRTPIRATFYYPWFPEAWNQQGTYPYTNYHPSAGFYDSGDSAVVRAHIEAMQYGHIELGIASWWGIDRNTNTRFPTLLEAASGTGFKWAAYYEPEGQKDPTADEIRADLTYLKESYSSDPAYYTISGKFVVFVYADTLDGCAMVDRWTEANTVGAYIVLKVFPEYRSCANQPDGWHQYGPAVAASNQSPYSYSISPGFWKVGEQPPLERDPGRWRQNIRDMIASAAQFQLVISFNEWGEGTGVESTTEWATASGYGEYLDALHTNGAEPPPTATPTATASPIVTPTETVTFTPTETATPEPTATPTEPVTPEPTETPTVTPTPAPAQIVFTWADNRIFVGQQSSAEMCWINPGPGAGTGELSVMASRSAGTLNGSPQLTIVGVPINGFLTTSLTMAEPCVTIPVRGEASGIAFLVVEVFGQEGVQSSPSVTIENPVASLPPMPMR